jgi:hypothetical protein
MHITHGGRNAKHFVWVYNNDIVKITNENGRKEEYSLAEILAIFNWLVLKFGITWFPLANNVAKLGRNEESDGLGVAILRQHPKKISHAQGASYLGVIMENVGLLEWNGRHWRIEWRIIVKQTLTTGELRKFLQKNRS